jgi:SAM-dependent methyltransferase
LVVPNPYDELPYRSTIIEWTAPERLALASLLHGGPRLSLESYRVLELGCGDGTNLVSLAHDRPHAAFVGVDGARGAIETASARKAELDLPNLQFIHADFASAADRLAGPFDIIVAHGVFSWVTDDVRDGLFALCARHLRPGGLLYLNYNARPGWNVRGMVRDFLLAQTAHATGLRARAELAQQLSATLADLLAAAEHPYPRLMEREFRFACESHLSYVAHEHLAADNHAYWRDEFLALAGRFGLEYVADADFNLSSGRVQADLIERLSALPLLDGTLDHAVDLLAYRQLHSPILTAGPWTPTPAAAQELADLLVASSLEPLPSSDGRRMFRHANGFEVEAKGDSMGAALERLFRAWPSGVRLGALFPLGSALVDDIRLLHRHGLIDLRLGDLAERAPAPGTGRRR